MFEITFKDYRMMKNTESTYRRKRQGQICDFCSDLNKKYNQVVMLYKDFIFKIILISVAILCSNMYKHTQTEGKTFTSW